MKNLLMMTLVAIVAVSAIGCQRPWFSRGAACNTAPAGIPDCHTGSAPLTGSAYIPAESTPVYPTPGT